MTSGLETVGDEVESAGLWPDALVAAVELVRARGVRAQLVVLHEGRTVLDRSFGCAPDALFFTFSASKAYTSVLVHRLVEQGLLGLDEPVAASWPQFARYGKGAVTVRHVLQHRSGFATAGAPLGEALALTDWDRMVHRLERTRLRWTPGEVPAYQYLAFGFVLGEVVRRITGRELPELLQAEILTPLGARATFLGLPDEAWSRHVPVQPAALAEAVRPTSDGEVDRITRLPVRWSQGFQLAGPRTAPGPASPMGSRSSPRAFGHNGSDCCIGWADPDRGLVVAYLTDRLGPRRTAMAHLTQLADLLLGAAPVL